MIIMAAFLVVIYCFLMFGSTFVSSDGNAGGGGPAKTVQLSGGKGPIEGKQTLKFLYWYV